VSNRFGGSLAGMTYAFLSDDWIDAALAMHDEFADKVPTPDQTIKMNLIINDTPFGPADILLHIDNSDGLPRISRDHVDGADVTITTDHPTARDLFVSGDQSLAMQAFMTGKIRVDGDITKLMAMQAGAMTSNEELTSVRDEVTRRLQDLTAPHELS
jgi:putative sterol carrier protein